MIYYYNFNSNTKMRIIKMAIIAPADLPSVLKLRSEPMKKYVLTKLGYPVVNVEISEDQWETIWRVAGDFIAGYFPREQKLSVFWTSPLRPTYPLPDDAYWVQSVSWDPITTRIDDVFGAESFLFCWAGGTQLLTTDGPKTCEEVHNNKGIKLVTPFGPREPELKWNEKPQPVQVLKTEKDYLICTPNHPVNIDNKFKMAIWGYPGMKLLDSDDKQPSIVDRDRSKTDGTWSVSIDSGCYYVSSLGQQFYLVH
jgi:hypothetical protein